MQHDNKSFQAEWVSAEPIWISGSTGSGKTTRLIERLRELQQWASLKASETAHPSSENRFQNTQNRSFLMFAASGEARLALSERVAAASGRRSATADLIQAQPQMLAKTSVETPVEIMTPISFFQREVTQHWLQLMQQLGSKAQTPLRLHPETEQALAAQLWRSELNSGQLRQAGVRDALSVQRALDLLRLAAASGTPHEQIPLILQQGGEQVGSPELGQATGKAIQRWWRWCLDRGCLTYATITELYWRYLLPDPGYQQQLKQRYRAVLVDDLDEYVAATRLLFEFWLDQGIPAAFTFNPNGAARLGLGADPDYLAGLASRCRVETLNSSPERIGSAWGSVVIDSLRNPLALVQLPDSMQVIQTQTKAQLLRQTAETITAAVQSGEIQPHEVAIIAPGIDPISRYTLQGILSSKAIPLVTLNLQQPLIRSALVRALLTLLALVYGDLGHLVNREAVAEMLVVLSQSKPPPSQAELPFSASIDPSFVIPTEKNFPAPIHSLKPRVDAVRAGLLADYCFVPDAAAPHLLPATSFARWDRLGYQAAQSYSEILQWIEHQRQAPVNLPELLHRATERFFGSGSELIADQRSILQELLEAAEHYWQVEIRLSQFSRSELAISAAVGEWIQLLQAGTITGNPTSTSPSPQSAVMLATAYQYRNQPHSHRWQFWLDAGSSFWLTGNAQLFAAPLFLHNRLNRIWTATDQLAAHQDYLEREVSDLLDRATERIYLCHCELAVNGQEQSGVLMPLVNAAMLVPAPVAS